LYKVYSLYCFSTTSHKLSVAAISHFSEYQRGMQSIHIQHRQCMPFDSGQQLVFMHFSGN